MGMSINSIRDGLFSLQSRLMANQANEFANIFKSHIELVRAGKNNFLARRVTSLKCLKASVKAVVFLALNVFITLLSLPLNMIKKDFQSFKLNCYFTSGYVKAEILFLNRIYNEEIL